jgi:hypothetical protein
MGQEIPLNGFGQHHIEQARLLAASFQTGFLASDIFDIQAVQQLFIPREQQRLGL